MSGQKWNSSNLCLSIGIEGLKLLEKGLTPEEALDRLLMEDPHKEQRQVAIMDFKMRKATFTGVKAPDFRREVIGKTIFRLKICLLERKW